eukprot:Rmarinus@m.15215
MLTWLFCLFFVAGTVFGDVFIERSIIDVEGDNFFIRGPMLMKDNDGLSMDTLRTQLQAVVSQELGLTLPDTFEMKVINVGIPKFGESYKNHETFFKTNLPKGSYKHWPIYGDTKRPAAYTEEMRNDMAAHVDQWSKDKLHYRVHKIREWLSIRGNVPLVVYVYCEDGLARTGELVAAYEMQYNDQPFDRAVALAGRAKKDPAAPHLNSLLWYCLHLQTERGDDTPRCD